MQNYEEQDELDALLGEVALSQPQPTEPKYELSTETTTEELQQNILEELGTTVAQSNSAVNAVLTELAMSPSDPAVISAASSLLNAHSKVIESMSKLYALHEKHQQNKEITHIKHQNSKELLAMKLMVDHKMNQENNETQIQKVMLTREQAMRRKGKDVHVIDNDC